ncbi:PRTRC system protein A [Cupriavidus sp. SW-Y-13]|uniref:PRTRC system protein A n=1 Tax=Cupriavidus sp. SW-Y-13 TaxID=2653854 RepID=UPI0013658F92|nr:PRTRC system protein A [Cupriavidus sp. SW-Y-13]MWL91394.1 PRTRC system protein A [Cupriavidus sp. SW-Y-13]
MHPADNALQQSFPSVMVPRFGQLDAMVKHGERLLIASNGVFLEIARPWLRVVRQLGVFSHPTAIPYGEAAEATQLHCGRVPSELIGEFATMARAAYPKETGAWIVWNAVTGIFRLIPLGIIEHSAGHLKYERPALADDDVLVVDCHSHGSHPAFFSPTDDADDCHDVKFAFVLGNCAAYTPSMALRLCAKGIFETVERVPGDWYAAAREEVLA